jgi:hypothetical protein
MWRRNYLGVEIFFLPGSPEAVIILTLRDEKVSKAFPYAEVMKSFWLHRGLYSVMVLCSVGEYKREHGRVGNFRNYIKLNFRREVSNFQEWIVCLSSAHLYKIRFSCLALPLHFLDANCFVCWFKNFGWSRSYRSLVRVWRDVLNLQGGKSIIVQPALLQSLANFPYIMLQHLEFEPSSFLESFPVSREVTKVCIDSSLVAELHCALMHPSAARRGEDHGHRNE